MVRFTGDDRPIDRRDSDERKLVRFSQRKLRDGRLEIVGHSDHHGRKVVMRSREPLTSLPLFLNGGENQRGDGPPS
jgi:hypothetical protein